MIDRQLLCTSQLLMCFDCTTRKLCVYFRNDTFRGEVLRRIKRDTKKKFRRWARDEQMNRFVLCSYWKKNAIFNGDVQILNSVRCRTVVFGNRFLPVSNITSRQLIIIAIWTVHGAINRKSLLLLITIIIIKKYFLSSPRLQRNTFRRCVLGHWNKTMRGAVA